MKKLHIIPCLLISLLTSVLSSCLGDGQETFALQRGDFESLIIGGWRVTKCELYDIDNDTYHSDLLNDPLLDYSFILDEENPKAVDSMGRADRLSWSANEENQRLSLQSKSYKIVSLGKGLMVLSRADEIDDESFNVRYYLAKVDADAILIDEDLDEDATYVVSTSGSGSFKRNGYRFTIPVGAVPPGSNGANGSVAFSAQTIPVENLPANAPSGVSFVEGSGILANPSNFTFASPLIISVPLRGYMPRQAQLYRWDALNRVWTVIPYSSINGTESANVSVIELGYFALGVSQSTKKFGGIKINKSQLNGDYHYYLTLSPKNGGNSSSIAFSSGGNDLYMSNVELGSYNAQITREKRTTLQSGAISIESSSVNISVDVRNELTGSGASFANYSGWTTINLANIDWTNGRPNLWGDETITYGTGTFQATLNWVNYTSSTVDYDLHLTTPNGTEIYYSNKVGDGFELDRDITTAIGNCIENIYSISENLPSGTYKVRVHHYGGVSGRNYNCRIILNGRVVSSYSGITNSGYQTIYTFTLR